VTDTGTARTICTVARSMLESRCSMLPDHLIVELAGIASDDTLPPALRREAELLIEEGRE
jgi:hypothetical protein